MNEIKFGDDGLPTAHQPGQIALARSMIWRYEHGVWPWRQDRVDAWRERLAFHEAKAKAQMLQNKKEV